MDVMSIFKSSNKNVNKEKMEYAKTMRGGYPSYAVFGDNVMNDETVFTITQRIINEYSKLTPRHIRTVDGKQVKISDTTIQTLLKFPNRLETISDFLSKACYMYLSYDNVFIYPIYDLYRNNKTGKTKKVYSELKILQPSGVTFYEDSQGNYFVEFQFRNGKKSPLLDYNDIIHWRKDYGINEFLGGDERGLPNNSSLLKHLRLNDQLLQSTIKTINGSLTINGVLKYVTLVNPEQREKERQKFVEDLKNNESGIITLDGGSTYENLDFKGQLIDKDTLEFLDKKTARHYGVSQDILDGKYDSTDKEAFYETVLEHGIISLGYAFERAMLTPFERANGNEIIFYSSKIQMLSHDKKISLAQLLQPTGGVTNNQILGWFGEPPYEGGDERYVSLNWIRKDIAETYQLETYKYGKKKDNSKDNSKNDDKNGDENDDENKKNDDENSNK